MSLFTLDPPLPIPSSGAEISACGRYRYTLMRRWDAAEPMACWVMLNPSTADAAIDDPTIRRVVGFSKAWLFGGCVVVNLFALRSPEPKALNAAIDPIGMDNDGFIVNTATRSNVGIVIAAWGSFQVARHPDRAHNVAALLRRNGAVLHYLKLSNKGHPYHPLYLPAELKPQAWV